MRGESLCERKDDVDSLEKMVWLRLNLNPALSN